MELIFDDREHKLWQHAQDYDNVSRAHLTTGDILIGRRTAEDVLIPFVIIERKTWADLAASIKDGRKANIEKLKEYRETTGARLAYLMEGPVPSGPDWSIPEGVQGIPYRNLRAHLDHLLFRDGIIELTSSCPRDSLRRLLEFARNLETLDFNKESKEDGLAAATKKRPLTDEQISDRIWSSFAGISATSARAFRTRKIQELFQELDVISLAAIKIGTRRFGTERAEKLINSLKERATFERLLCAVPQISSKRATLIIDKMGSANSFFRCWDETNAALSGIIPRACLNTIEKYLFCLPRGSKTDDAT